MPELPAAQEQDHGIDALAFSHDDRFLISCILASLVFFLLVDSKPPKTLNPKLNALNLIPKP